MKRTPQDLFTVQYAITYDKWVMVEPDQKALGFFNSYTRGSYKIDLSAPIYYNLVRIRDNKDVVKFYGYIKSLADYEKVKKKLKW
jgi:hypothetical protein